MGNIRDLAMNMNKNHQDIILLKHYETVINAYEKQHAGSCTEAAVSVN